MAAAPKTADSIFWLALEIGDLAQREQYIDQACGSDSELRLQIREMITAYPKADQFLERPAAAAAATALAPPSTEAIGTMVGPYKLREQIGEGGMGVVYVAEQLEPVRRKVALKVIKPGMDTREVIARFESERQALALMDHPNIAKVLEAGTADSGRPYFVMELVRGIPITEYCDQARLTPRKRLELFILVCQAVQHAHQKGIIHRDLKPSNVLVTLHDGVPMPKVIDFGVAKAINQRLTEESVYTQALQMVGTPLYMSPEQAELSGLDIDTRTDVYSLGVLLYELLTGSTPFDREALRKASFDEIRRIIREEEPRKPSTLISTLGAALTTLSEQRGIDPRKLAQTVRGELDWIVMKALEKDRTRRYESASALAADVTAHLNDEPVKVCPPSRVYRLRKFARRNKAALTTVVAVSIALLVGTGVSVWQAVRATDAGAFALINAQRAEANAQRAEANLRLALRAVDEMYTQVAAVDDSHEQVAGTHLAYVPHMTPFRRVILEKALAFYEEFAKQNSTDPDVRQERGKAYRRVGGIQRRLGEYELARKAYRQAITLGEKLVADFSAEPDYQSELAWASYGLAHVFQDTGRFEDAHGAFRQALDLQQKMVAENPKKLDFRRKLASTHNCLGGLLLVMGRTQEAEHTYRQALAISEELSRTHPESPKDQNGLASNLINLGNVYQDKGQWGEAEAAYQKALALREKLVREHPEVPGYQNRLAVNFNNLGIVYQDKGQWGESVAVYQKAVALREKLAREHSEVPEYQNRLAVTYLNLGNVYRSKGRTDEAVATYQKALAIQEKLVREHPEVPKYQHDLGDTYLTLGNVYRRKGRTDEAVAAYQKALALREKLAREHPEVPKYQHDLSTSHNNLGVVYQDTGRPDEAVAAYQKALALREKLVREHPEVPK